MGIGVLAARGPWKFHGFLADHPKCIDLAIGQNPISKWSKKAPWISSLHQVPLFIKQNFKKIHPPV
jgi:hypothetical protein